MGGIVIVIYTLISVISLCRIKYFVLKGCAFLTINTRYTVRSSKPAICSHTASKLRSNGISGDNMNLIKNVQYYRGVQILPYIKFNTP
jgi:hypothetical protein